MKIFDVDSGKIHLSIPRFVWASMRNKLMKIYNWLSCEWKLLHIHIHTSYTYPHAHKYFQTHTQNYTQSHIHTRTIVLHTHTIHTHEDMFRHTYTRVTQNIEKTGTGQELGEFRVTDKSVVESRVSESIITYMYFVLYDGGSNSRWSSKWIMGHEQSGN